MKTNEMLKMKVEFFFAGTTCDERTPWSSQWKSVSFQTSSNNLLHSLLKSSAEWKLIVDHQIFSRLRPSDLILMNNFFHFQPQVLHSWWHRKIRRSREWKMKERLQASRWHLSSINSIFTLSFTPFQLYSYFPLSVRERPDPCRWKLHPSGSQIFEPQKLNVTHSKSHSKCNENSTQSEFFTLQDVTCCGCRKISHTHDFHS